MPTRLSSAAFSGGSDLATGRLAAMLRDQAIRDAKTQVAALVTATTLAVLTDNSGGAAANGTVENIPIPTAGFTEVGTASAQKAGFETALGTVKNAITELAAKLVTIKPYIPASDIVNNVGGTAADGTIAAITVSLTAVNTSIASFTGSRTVMQNVKNQIYQLVLETNKFAVAVGVTPLANAITGAELVANALPALSTDTGTAVDGTAASGVSKVAADAFLAACAAAVKEIATKINAVLGVTAPTEQVIVAA